MKTPSYIQKIIAWFFTPVMEEEKFDCSETFPTSEYFIWVKAGQPQEKGIDLTWDSKKEDNPKYDYLLAVGRARLRRLLVDEIKKERL